MQLTKEDGTKVRVHFIQFKGKSWIQVPFSVSEEAEDLPSTIAAELLEILDPQIMDTGIYAVKNTDAVRQALTALEIPMARPETVETLKGVVVDIPVRPAVKPLINPRIARLFNDITPFELKRGTPAQPAVTVTAPALDEKTAQKKQPDRTKGPTKLYSTIIPIVFVLLATFTSFAFAATCTAGLLVLHRGGTAVMGMRNRVLQDSLTNTLSRAFSWIKDNRVTLIKKGIKLGVSFAVVYLGFSLIASHTIPFTDITLNIFSLPYIPDSLRRVSSVREP